MFITRKYVSSDKELMGVKRMAEGDSRGGGESYELRNQKKGCGDFL